jgi:large subunit ribosomal protein L4e
MSGRPTVGIVGGDGKASGSTHPLPAVFSAPIRPDIVQYAKSLFEAPDKAYN